MQGFLIEEFGAGPHQRCRRARSTVCAAATCTRGGGRGGVHSGHRPSGVGSDGRPRAGPGNEPVGASPRGIDRVCHRASSHRRCARRRCTPPWESRTAHRLDGGPGRLFYQNPCIWCAGRRLVVRRAGRAYLDAYTTYRMWAIVNPTSWPRFNGRPRPSPRIPATCTRISDTQNSSRLGLPDTWMHVFFRNPAASHDVAWRMAQMATRPRGGPGHETLITGITDAVAALTPGVGTPQTTVVTIAPPPRICG